MDTMTEQSGDMTAAFASALSSAPATPAVEAPPASSTQTTETPAESSPAAAIAQPAATETPAVEPSTETKGEPPKWRWQDILENTRQSVSKETEARIRQEYEWAKDIPQHERDGIITWRRAMNGDPQAIAQIKANQQATAWLKGLVAEPEKPAEDPEPEPDYVLPVKDANGTVVGEQAIYSAAQQKKWQEWNKKQLRSEFQKELQPFKADREQSQSERAQATYQATTASVIAQMESADPAFKTHKAAVGEAIQKDADLLSLALTNPKLAIELAWGRVHRERVLPQQQQQTEAKVLTDLQQKAVASTVNPTAPTATNPKKFAPSEQGFAEALAHFGAAR